MLSSVLPAITECTPHELLPIIPPSVHQRCVAGSGANVRLCVSASSRRRSSTTPGCTRACRARGSMPRMRCSASRSRGRPRRCSTARPGWCRRRAAGPARRRPGTPPRRRRRRRCRAARRRRSAPGGSSTSRSRRARGCPRRTAPRPSPPAGARARGRGDAGRRGVRRRSRIQRGMGHGDPAEAGAPAPVPAARSAYQSVVYSEDSPVGDRGWRKGARVECDRELLQVLLQHPRADPDRRPLRDDLHRSSAETGLMVGFFLPGDSLLVTAGLFAARGDLDIVVARALPDRRRRSCGNATGYWIGNGRARRSTAGRTRSSSAGSTCSHARVLRAARRQDDHPRAVHADRPHVRPGRGRRRRHDATAASSRSTSSAPSSGSRSMTLTGFFLGRFMPEHREPHPHRRRDRHLPVAAAGDHRLAEVEAGRQALTPAGATACRRARSAACARSRAAAATRMA